MRVLDLFSGIGGFSLAAHAVGFDTVAFCEIEPYPQSILRRHFLGVPVFDDVKELTADALAHAERRATERRGGHRELDRAEHEAGERLRDAARSSREGRYEGDGVHEPLILTAGFPCQDISYAGKGAGLAGERSGLFYEVARLVGELRPDYVLLENVAALLTRGLDAVLGTLASLGYDTLWACVPACAVGAPHRRDRVWLLAIPESPDSKQRLEAMYAHVLSRLTPFGDDRWSTPIANEAEKRGDHNEGLRGEVVRNGDRWPTATTRDWKGACASEVEAGGNGRLDNVVEGITGNGTWATPNQRDYKGSPSPAWSEQASLPRDVEQGTRENGALNPAWVCTLMGYPIGYTLPEGEPLTTLPTRWPAGLGAPQHEWEPPRLTTEKKHRAPRLKTLGNSIVPEVALLWMESISREEGRYAS